jgi:hypothetical protein
MDFSNCPICGKEIIRSNDFNLSLECKNGCYQQVLFMGFTNHIFRHPNGGPATVTVYNEDPELDKKKDVIEQIIAYWKEDDRYVAEILSR